MRAAQAEDINTCIITDAGRTQIPSGSKTVLAVGPGIVLFLLFSKLHVQYAGMYRVFFF